jgi:hypothetical protein
VRTSVVERRHEHGRAKERGGRGKREEGLTLVEIVDLFFFFLRSVFEFFSSSIMKTRSNTTATEIGVLN